MCRSPRGSADRNDLPLPNGLKPGTSLPARERGSKRHLPKRPECHRRSLPARERESKPVVIVGTVPIPCRSPRGSADRNFFRDLGTRLACVAPRAGARIETYRGSHPPHFEGGRSPRGSADRNIWLRIVSPVTPSSLPARERGSKQMEEAGQPVQRWSLPARERGSKQCRLSTGRGVQQSLPARERGSKQQRLLLRGGEPARRSPRGSADRNLRDGVRRRRGVRRSPRGSADRNPRSDRYWL